MKNDLLSIGEASKLKGVSVKSLRYYEKLGILVPAYVDPNSGYRYYSTNQMIDLDVIIICIELGIPLKLLADFQTNGGTLDLAKLLAEGRSTALKKIRRAEDSLLRIDSYLEEISQQESLRKKEGPYRRTFPECQVLTLPWKEPSFSTKAYLKAMTQLYQTAETCRSTPLYFQGFSVTSSANGTAVDAYVQIGRTDGALPSAPFSLAQFDAGTYEGFRIERSSMSECMQDALEYTRTHQGSYSITEVWDAELPEGVYVVEVLRLLP